MTNDELTTTGKQMHELASRLFPICRSITGNGLRKSLAILQEYLPDLRIREIPTGTACFDWEIPKEWNIRDAYIICPDGRKICDFKVSNLHVVGYSTPIHEAVSLEELQTHLYSLPEDPDAIPYITSYYKERWGFCIPHSLRESLTPGDYQVHIDSELAPGSLSFGELIIPGETEDEIFLSTYLCHPSMANNELSGPMVATFLAKWISSLEHRRHTFRIVFIPETIGSIAYLSLHHKEMKRKIVAGFNLTCIGDDRSYSYLPSRQEDTRADQAALHVLRHLHPDFVTYSFLERGSDERQYCSPGIDLPVCSLMRTKYACYPEYHTSRDDLQLVTPTGLAGGYEVARKAIECLEQNFIPKRLTLCEPQLGKRNLYPTISTKSSGATVRVMMNFLAYVDGESDALAIAEKIGVPFWELWETIQKLKEGGVIVEV
jgi:aminopeptidase-like protein